MPERRFFFTCPLPANAGLRYDRKSESISTTPTNGSSEIEPDFLLPGTRHHQLLVIGCGATTPVDNGISHSSARTRPLVSMTTSVAIRSVLHGAHLCLFSGLPICILVYDMPEHKHDLHAAQILAMQHSPCGIYPPAVQRTIPQNEPLRLHDLSQTGQAH